MPPGNEYSFRLLWSEIGHGFQGNYDSVLTHFHLKHCLVNRNRNRNPNPNIRNKNWRRFCLESITNNNCSIKTFHPHIIFIYCYYIFYCRIFCVRRKIFLREFHIRVSVASWDLSTPPPFAALPSLRMHETRSPFNRRYE